MLVCKAFTILQVKKKLSKCSSTILTGLYEMPQIMYGIWWFSDKAGILFSYNANSDTGSKMLDFAHKIMSPATYNCALCSLTFGAFTEKKKWKTFRKTLLAKGYELSFLHKD